MAEEIRFSAAEANLVLHATEDHDKVLQSIEKVLSVPAGSFTGTNSDGHFGNKIVLFKSTLSSKEASELALRILSLLNRIDRQQLYDRLEDYCDEKGNLYLRLDKQRICQGKVSLSESDAIRIRFRPIRRYKPSGNIDTYRGLLSLIE
jgi:hypothetical protein